MPLLNAKRVFLRLELHSGSFDVAFELNHLFFFGVLFKHFLVLHHEFKHVFISLDRQLGAFDSKVIGLKSLLCDEAFGLQFDTVSQHVFSLGKFRLGGINKSLGIDDLIEHVLFLGRIGTFLVLVQGCHCCLQVSVCLDDVGFCIGNSDSLALTFLLKGS